jgi:hypothetical protein
MSRSSECSPPIKSSNQSFVYISCSLCSPHSRSISFSFVWLIDWFIHSFSCRSHLEHRPPFGVSVITRTIRHTVGLHWMSDQPVAETSTYTGQHNI